MTLDELHRLIAFEAGELAAMRAQRERDSRGRYKARSPEVAERIRLKSLMVRQLEWDAAPQPWLPVGTGNVWGRRD